MGIVRLSALTALLFLYSSSWGNRLALALEIGGRKSAFMRYQDANTSVLVQTINGERQKISKELFCRSAFSSIHYHHSSCFRSCVAGRVKFRSHCNEEIYSCSENNYHRTAGQIERIAGAESGHNEYSAEQRGK